MTDYRLILGIVASGVGFIGYSIYLRDVFLGKTKPHAFSWFVWGVLESIAFFAQITEGAGVGAWATGVSALITFLVAGIALGKPDKQIRKTDWVFFSSALLAILLWYLTQDPLVAVILVTLADNLGFIPTFHKSYYRPYEETLAEYALSILKWTLSIIALESFSLVTWLYPASLAVTNGAFVIMLLVRRKQSKK